VTFDLQTFWLYGPLLIKAMWTGIRRIVLPQTTGNSVSKYSKTSLIQTNWEQTFVQISESPNYRSALENMFREVIKWNSHVFLGNTTLF
jgi:hypothetical protein